jgi:hypothetical protein
MPTEDQGSASHKQRRSQLFAALNVRSQALGGPSEARR